MNKKKLISNYLDNDFLSMVDLSIELGVITRELGEQAKYTYNDDQEDKELVIEKFFDFIGISENEYQEIAMEILKEK